MSSSGARLAAEAKQRPAFYALRPGGWRDLVTLLHPPYTLWHVSYVAIGAAAAPQIHAGRLAAAIAAFFLAVGIGAHSLDELHGRPLGTHLSATSPAGPGRRRPRRSAGDRRRRDRSPSRRRWRPWSSAGGFLVLAYNLELFGGRFHTDFWFAASWGAFPALTGWWSNALALSSPREAIAATAAVLACFWLSVAQRRLSTPVRQLRRRTVAVSGEQRLADGTTRRLDAQSLSAPLDGALRALSVAVPILAIAEVALRI